MILRHFPTFADIEAAHKAIPDVFGPVRPFSRMHGSDAVEAVILASMSKPEEPHKE